MKPNESDLVLLINYVRCAPQIYQHVPGRGDMTPSGICELKVSLEQRNMLVRALECLRAVNVVR